MTFKCTILKEPALEAVRSSQSKSCFNVIHIQESSPWQSGSNIYKYLAEDSSPCMLEPRATSKNQ